MWIGIITKSGNSGPWKFATSGENVAPTYWQSSQPDHGGSKLCGFYHSDYLGEWFDAPCTLSFRFICEFA